MDELQKLATTTIGEDIEEEIVTLADRLREEGLQKGLKRGALHERRGLLLKQLALRFGELPEAAVARVNAAGMDPLDRWLELVLTAPTLADVIGAS